MVTCAAIGAVQERLTIAPIRGAPPFMQITVTLGVAVCIRGAALLIWGKDPHGLAGFSGDGVIEIVGAYIPTQALWVWGTTVVAIIATFWSLNATWAGRAIRAVSTNAVAARLMGINTGLVSLLVFTIGGGMGGLAGVVIAPITTVAWDTGLEYSVKALRGDHRRTQVARQGCSRRHGHRTDRVALCRLHFIRQQGSSRMALLLYLMMHGGVFTLGRRPLGANEQH